MHGVEQLFRAKVMHRGACAMRTFVAGLLLLLSRGTLLAQFDAVGVHIGSVVFIAQSTVADDGRTLRTLVHATNKGRDTVPLAAAGDCPVAVRVYRALGGAPVWDGSRHRRLCFGIERVVVLAPQKTIEFVQVDSVRRIVRGIVPAPQRSETYYFAAVLRVGRGELQIPAGRDRLKN